MILRTLLIFLALQNFVFAQKLNDNISVPLLTLESEQKLCGTTPFMSNIRNLVGVFAKGATSNGSLEQQYWPTEQKTFKLISILIPKEDFSSVTMDNNIDIESKAIFEVNKNGKIFCRFFIHPSQTEHYSSLITKYEKDSIKWNATPSSSARSLFVQDSQKQFKPFVAKVSLNLANGGMATRLIKSNGTLRGTMVTGLVNDLYNKTQGKLPDSKMTWDFFKEPASFMPPDEKLGGYVFRTLPNNFDKTISIPWYALISDRGDKPMWIEELYKASGIKSKTEFVFEKLIKPVVELYSMISFEAGLSSELHQQNLVLQFDPKTFEIKGVIFRDMEAMYVHESLRKSKLNLKPIEIPFEEAADNLRYYAASERTLKGYLEGVRFHSFKYIYKYFLSSNELKEVLRKGDQYLISKFNKAFPDYSISQPNQFTSTWRKLSNDVATPTERTVTERIQRAKFANETGESLYLMFLEGGLEYGPGKKSILTRCLRLMRY